MNDRWKAVNDVVLATKCNNGREQPTFDILLLPCFTLTWNWVWNVFVLFCFVFQTELCLLSNNITDYYFVAQGKTTIPSVDDGEEMQITDVSLRNGSTDAISHL